MRTFSYFCSDVCIFLLPLYFTGFTILVNSVHGHNFYNLYERSNTNGIVTNSWNVGENLILLSYIHGNIKWSTLLADWKWPVAYDWLHVILGTGATWHVLNLKNCDIGKCKRNVQHIYQRYPDCRFVQPADMSVRTHLFISL